MSTIRLRWEKQYSEAKDVLVTLAISGDDTTIVGKASEWNEEVTVVMEMGRWEERNNDDKEEML